MDTYTKLAKITTEHFVRQHSVLLLPSALSLDLRRQKACYVYVYENPGRRLRAVYGEPFPRYSCLAEEIINNTVGALTKHTFPVIHRTDLASLIYIVAVLDPLQRIIDATQLHPDKFGLYLHSDQGKSAVLLPQRTGVETAQDQIATALRESGSNPRQEAITMYRFGVTYYE
ncbi:MAG: AMMECR1 domain-containing protein [bacterium]